MDESCVRQLIKRVSKIERDLEAIQRRVKRLEYLRESDRRAMNTMRSGEVTPVAVAGSSSRNTSVR